MATSPLLLLSAVLLLTSSLTAARAIIHRNSSFPRPLPLTSPFPAVLKAASLVFPLKGDAYPNGEFHVTMNIGDPPKPYFLQIDTGSDLMWIQCDWPCKKCFQGPNPLYKPKKESVVKCNDPLCVALHESIGHDERCQPSEECNYITSYADKSESAGVLLTDAVSLTLINGGRTVTKQPQLALGCGYNQEDFNEPSKMDGLLGLGGGQISIPSQLRNQGLIQNVVGHCLGGEGDGYLFFGDDLIPASGMTWAPMVHIPDEYGYSPGKASVFLGQQALGVDEQYTFFDSGVQYTYFTDQRYRKILSAVRDGLKKKRKQLQEIKSNKEDLKICWKGERPFRSLAEVKNYFTSLVLEFANRRIPVQMEIPPENYLVITNDGNVCLGIFNAIDEELNENLIGAISLQDRLVIYDNEKQQIGWAKANCAGTPGTVKPLL